MIRRSAFLTLVFAVRGGTYVVRPEAKESVRESAGLGEMNKKWGLECHAPHGRSLSHSTGCLGTTSWLIHSWSLGPVWADLTSAIQIDWDFF